MERDICMEPWTNSWNLLNGRIGSIFIEQDKVPSFLEKLTKKRGLGGQASLRSLEQKGQEGQASWRS